MKKIISLISLFLLIFLVACEGDTNVKFEIQGIKGYNDAVINADKRTVTFNVTSTVSEFAVSDVLLPENIEISVYADANHETELGEILSLEYGLNTFYLNLYFAEDDALNSDWTLLITRIEQVNQIKEIVVSELKNTYEINEEFSNGKLKVIYMDEKQEEIPLTKDMVSGFDTSSVGEKTLTITYQGKTITYKIMVVDSSLSDVVSSISIKELKNFYLLNEEFVPGTLIVNYASGESKEIPLTKDMVSGFDTSSVGEKTLTITYQGKTITYSIVVSNSSDLEMEVTEVVGAYLVGEEFKPGIITVYLGDEAIEVPLTEDMVSGFDTSTPGQKEITIKYGDYEFKINIVVQSSLEDEVVKPEVTELNDTDVKEFMALVESFTMYISSNYKSFAEAYEYSKNDVEHQQEAVSQIKDILQNAGITKEKLLAFNELVRTDGVTLADKIKEFVINPNEETYNKLFSVENIDFAKECLSKIMDIITPYDLAMLYISSDLMNISSGNDSPSYNSIYYLFGLTNSDYIDENEYFDILKQAGLGVVVDFINSLDQEFRYDDLTYEEAYYISNGVYQVLNGLINANSSDIRNVIIEAYNLSNKGMSAETLVNLVNSGANVLESLRNSTNNFMILDNVYDIIISIIPKQNNNIEEMEGSLKIFRDALQHSDVIIDLAKEFDLEMANNIITLFSGSSPDIPSLIKLCQFGLPLIEDILNDTEYLESVSVMLWMMNIIPSHSLGTNFLNALKDIASYDPANLENSDYDEIMMLLQNGMMGEYIRVGSSFPVLSLEELESEEVYNILSQYITAEYYSPEGMASAIVLDETTVTLNYNGSCGYQKGYIKSGKTQTQFYYFVYESIEDLTLEDFDYYNFTEYLFAVALNEDKPTFVKNKFSLNESYSYSLEEFINNNYASAYYQYSKDNIRIYRQLDLNNMEFVVDSSKVGLVDAYIIIHDLKDIYIPIQVFVYDDNNPIITSDVNINIIGNYDLTSNRTNYIEQREESLVVSNVEIYDIILNLNKYIDNIYLDNTSFTANEIDLNDLGKHELVININLEEYNLEIEKIIDIYVYSEAERNYISDVYAAGSINILEGTTEMPSDTSIELVTYGGSSYRVIYEELDYYLKQIYGSNAYSEAIKEDDYFVLNLYDNNNDLVLSDKLYYSEYTEDDLNKYSIEFYDNRSLVVSSYDILTPEYVINNLFDILTLRQNGTDKQIHITDDIYNTLVNKYNFSFELIEQGKGSSYTYYELRVYQGDKNSWTSTNIEVYLEENLNTPIDVYLDLPYQLILKEVSEQSLYEAISYFGRLVVNYPFKTVYYEGDELYDLIMTEFSIESLDTINNYLIGYLFGLELKIYFGDYILVNENTNINYQIYVDTIISNNDDLLDVIKTKLEYIEIDGYGFKNGGANFNYFLNNLVLETNKEDLILSEDNNIEISLFGAKGYITVYYLDKLSLLENDNYSIELNNSTLYGNIENIEELIYKEDMSIYGNETYEKYMLSEADKKVLQANSDFTYSLVSDNNYDIVITYNGYEKHLSITLVNSIENDIEISFSDYDFVKYDLLGNPLDSEVIYLRNREGLEIDELLRDSITTIRVGREYFSGEELIDFIDNYLTYNKEDNGLIKLNISYNEQNYSSLIAIREKDMAYGFNISLKADLISNISEIKSLNDILKYISKVDIYYNDYDSIIYNYEEIENILNKINLIEVVKGENSYSLICQLDYCIIEIWIRQSVI